MTSPGDRGGPGGAQQTVPGWLHASEPERYELREVTLGTGETTRREFLKVLGGGLVVVLITRDPFGAPASAGTALESGRAGDAPPEVLSAWLHIAEDGAVTVYTGKVEFGQGIRTSLAQMVAEELRVPLEAIELVMGDTDLTPWDMGTFGSRSTPQMGTQLRKVAAAAREVLIGLAAERWDVDRAALEARDGRIIERAGGGRSAAYGELTRGRELTETVRDNVPLFAPTSWRISGTSAPKTTGRDVVTGRLEHTSDLRLPGMLIGKVLRPPAVGATLASVDTTAAAAQSGVIVAHEEDDFVGVAAPDLPTAVRALRSVRATWRRTPQPPQDELFELLRTRRPRDAPRRGEFGGAAHFTEGDVARALKAADHRFERTYTVSYIAHVPLEPRAAVARWEGDHLTVWTGTQRPFGVRAELAQALGMAEERVRVIVPDTGSGYGGKHTGECAVEAARLARVARRPVRLVWTREEEFRWAYFRPAGVIDIRACASADGTITGWELDNYNSGGAAIRSLYAIENQRIDFHPSESPFRQGSYRALAATANNFTRELHIDQLASIVGLDPLQMRLHNLRDRRMRDALESAAERFGWDARSRNPGAGIGRGIAGGFEKGSYVATCAEVEVSADGDVKVRRVVTAFDCGAVVNPDNLRNQIEGALVQGLGGALFEEIEFDDGVVLTDRLSSYRVPRFADVPRLETVLVDRKDQPSVGAGETPLIALAPAIGSAIAAATGEWPVSLPMRRRRVKSEE